MHRIWKAHARLLQGCAIVALAFAAQPASAKQASRVTVELPAQPLADALRALAILSKRSVLVDAPLVADRTAPPVSGTYRVEDVLDALLSGTGLAFQRAGGGFVILLAKDIVTDPVARESDVVITGSRIRGAAVASPVISISRESARDSGQATLGEVVRSIPQSFAGGQNPGIGFNVPSINGSDVGGGSSINLRGLGSDATLTLLNGHRVAYSGSRQSVDVSTIPLGAVDRIEIVPDGASALYGSDAVGGVANIILRRDMDGFETRARIGTSTQGGAFSQQYDATAGFRWASGGLLAAYEFNRATAIDASDRRYAATRSPGLRLLPSTRNNNVVLSGHQMLVDALALSVDGLFNERRNLFVYSQDPAGNLARSRVAQATTAKAFSIAPTLSLSLGTVATVQLSGGYATDEVRYRIDSSTPAGTTLLGAGCYCNRAQSVELSGDTRLFRLPGGWAKAALGVGYRETFLRNDRGTGSPLNFERALANRYAYGEVSLPVVGPDTDISGVYRLNLSGAVRYERYDEFGSVATPKVGLRYAPFAALDLKASWGQSFRAPTLLQRYQPPALTLLRATTFGGTGYPATATALYIQGGNANLKPERASSWSLSAALHPPTLRNLTLEISYFSTHYRDRIVTPIGFITQALSDPIYAAQVTRAPSVAALATIIASGASFSNGTGVAYDPTKVVAFIDNSSVNAGRQPIHGLDALLSYRADLGTPGDSITLTGNATYLNSHRQISASQPDLRLAGILFNPPNWRGRGSAGWQHGTLTVTSNITYIGSLSDTRATPAVRIPSQATFDLTLRYRLPDRVPAVLRGLDLTLSVQNLFDAAPPPIAIGPVTDTPYDSTNYSPIGRFVSFTIARKW